MVTGRQRGPRDQAAPELAALDDLGLRQHPARAAQRLMDGAPVLDDGPQHRGIGRDGVIPALHLLVEGEVLLDEACAQGDGGEWDRRAQGVVTETHGNVEGAAQGLEVAQVDGRRRRRVEGDAVEQDDLLIVLGTHGIHGSLDLAQGGHARRDHEGLARPGNMGQERQVGDVHRGDLDERDVQSDEQVRLRRGERARGEGDPALQGVVAGNDVLLGRELVGAHHLAERPEVLLLVRVAGVPLVFLVGDERRLAPRLELDRVGARVGGSVDQLQAEIHVPVVVGADLGDDVRRVVAAHGDIAQVDGSHVGSFGVLHKDRRGGWATDAHQTRGGGAALSSRT